MKNIITLSSIPPDPFSVIENWMAAAQACEPNDPAAACLATVSEGKPNARMVLIKDWDQERFVFFTNEGSAKGQSLTETPYAALCFHWKSLRRQVRIEGDVRRTDDDVADEYFATRSRGSQLSAWSSDQSQPLKSYDDLLNKKCNIEKKFKDKDVPRPPYWVGYAVHPEKIELWEDGEDRLHRRILFTKHVEGWAKTYLNP